MPEESRKPVWWLLLVSLALTLSSVSHSGEVVVPPYSVPSAPSQSMGTPDYSNSAGQSEGRSALVPVDPNAIGHSEQDLLKIEKGKDGGASQDCLPGEYRVDSFDPDTLSDASFCTADPENFNDNEVGERVEDSEIHSEIECGPNEIRTETLDTDGLKYVVQCVRVEASELNLKPGDEAECILQTNPFDPASAGQCAPFAFGLSDALEQDLRETEKRQKEEEEKDGGGGYLLPFSANQTVFEDNVTNGTDDTGGSIY